MLGKDVKLPTEPTTYAVGQLGCPSWSVYLSLLYPPAGIAMLFSTPTKVTVGPDGIMHLRAVLRTVASFEYDAEDRTRYPGKSRLAKPRLRSPV